MYRYLPLESDPWLQLAIVLAVGTAVIVSLAALAGKTGPVVNNETRSGLSGKRARWHLRSYGSRPPAFPVSLDGFADFPRDRDDSMFPRVFDWTRPERRFMISAQLGGLVGPG